MTKPAPRTAAAYTQKTFGFQKAASGAARTAAVLEVFKSVAPKYDLMNDLMSLGVHRLWKAEFVRALAPQAGEALLDLAGGTGDIAMACVAAVEKKVRRFEGSQVRRNDASAPPHLCTFEPLTVCDINPAMLATGEARAADKGFFGKITWVEGNAERLPFEANSFDAATIAFGLRNVTHISAALEEVVRVLKPGGRFYCLEFSRPALPVLEKIYDRYSFSVLPFLGGAVAGDAASYRYLAESIRAFPEQDKLAALMRAAGFNTVRWRNLSLGIAAIHSGFKA